MIHSEYAGNLTCLHACGKKHTVHEWPINGDSFPFYFQKKPGNYSVRVYCPYRDKEWHIVWDDDPGRLISTGFPIEVPDPAKRASMAWEKESKKPLIFKVDKLDHNWFKGLGMLYGHWENKDCTQSIVISTQYTDDAYAQVRTKYGEMTLTEYLRDRINYDCFGLPPENPNEYGVNLIMKEPEPSPCPYCGKPLKTPKAKQCFNCHTDWHDPNNIIKHEVNKESEKTTQTCDSCCSKKTLGSDKKIIKESIKMNTVKCAHCRGKGEEFARMDLNTGKVEYRTCDVCNGTGKVTADKSHFTKYPDKSLVMANELMRQYGEPVEIYIAGNHDIRVLFENGYRFILGGFTVGYRGTGPDYMKAFLDAAGFDISIDSIADMQPPITLHAGQPYVPIEALVFEAPTIESAKTKAKRSIPSNAKIIDFEVIQGSTKTNVGRGVSKEEAVEDARSTLPKEAEIVEEKVVMVGKKGTQNVMSYSELEARENVRKQLPVGAKIKKIVCKEPSSKGFLGFGLKPGTYEVSWMKRWTVHCKYRQPAAVRVRFQPLSK